MKRLLTILCLLIPSLGIKAGTLRGKIIDQDAQPVAGAVITYYSYSDNSILATTTSDVNGNWELSYEEAWNDIQIVARAEGYTSYTLHGFNVSMNHTWPKIFFRLFNAIDYKAGKRSTIYLPETPDASWGRFYRLDHEDGNKVVFEREHTPKAYVPYVFFPYQDLHIDISKMDLSDHHDQVRLEHISFSSAINYLVADQPGSLVTQPMDETLPYAEYSEEGAIEDYLSPAPMHAILSWWWYDFVEGNKEDGTWQAVSPEFIFHDPEPTTYHPFVEQGKRWCVHGFSMGGQHTVTDYSFSDALEYISHDGHEYFKLVAWSDNKLTEVGELREEKQRVYLYDTEAGKEYLIYDFSLDVGDTFYESRSNRTLTVDSIGQMIVNGDTLKRLYLNDDDGMFTADWVEGIGSLNGPLQNVIGDEPIWNYKLAYVSGSRYWPLTFSLPSNGWWGQKLTRGQEDQEYARTHSFDENDLHYELVPDPEHDAYALHVSGIMWLYCGGELYTYCRRERSEDGSAYKLYFQLDTPTDYTDCSSPYHVDLSFPFFLAEHEYIAVDERGEHPVAIRDAAYRPFIEEGKVWKVGWFPGAGNTAQKLDYYYFDGDSITIDGKVCLKMRCRHEANEQWGNPEPWSEYVGAFYEEGRKVFCVFPDKQDFELLYDFESNIGDTIQVYGGVGADQYPTVSCIISKREYINDELFKGGVTYVDVEEPEWDNETQTFINKYNHNYPYRWLEGVGSGTPFANIMFSGWDGFYDDLMSCTVGDEILYYNPYLIDGVTPPDGAEVKRQWLDFTHIKKPRPRAPRKEGYGMTAEEGSDAETLTGEYSIKDLFVNFKPLSGAYTITVTDANDEEVYHKEVQTDNVIALNTALSTYAPGTYTLTVENAEEAYTATFILDDETAVHDLPSDAMVNSNPVNGKCYDLSGRPIPHSSFLKGQASKLERVTRHLPKGIYIRDGKKVVVK